MYILKTERKEKGDHRLRDKYREKEESQGRAQDVSEEGLRPWPKATLEPEGQALRGVRGYALAENFELFNT